MSEDTVTYHLTQDLFQLFKRLPHLQLNIQPIKGLTDSEHELLVILRFNITSDKPMLTASEITRLLHITPSGGTHLFIPLERAGFITREQEPRDRRITRIGLTEKGMAATDALLKGIQAQFNGLIAYLGEENSKTFISLLGKAIDYFALQPATQKVSENDREAAPAYS